MKERKILFYNGGLVFKIGPIERVIALFELRETKEFLTRKGLKNNDTLIVHVKDFIMF